MIFITGSGRCGTTLLRSLLDEHSGLDVYPNEVSSILELFNQASGFTSELRTEELLQENRRSQIHRLLQTLAITDVDRASLEKIFNPEQQPTLTIHQLLSEVQRFYFPDSKKQIVFDATSPCIKGYLEIRDDVRVIHMLRHPYNTMNSFFRERYADPNHTGGAHPGEWSFGKGFERIEETFYQASLHVDHPRVLLVRLESLQSSPKKVVSDCLNFLGLEFEDNSLSQTRLGKKFLGNSTNRLSEKIFRQSDDWTCLTANDLYFLGQTSFIHEFYNVKTYEWKKNKILPFLIRQLGFSGRNRVRLKWKSIFNGRIVLLIMFSLSFFLQDRKLKLQLSEKYGVSS